MDLNSHLQAPQNLAKAAILFNPFTQDAVKTAVNEPELNQKMPSREAFNRDTHR